MRQVSLKAVLAASSFVLAPWLCPVAHGGVILDQSFVGQGAGAQINECCAFVGQTYTSGATGELAGVSVDIEEFSGNAFPLDIQIRTVSNSVPTTTVLGEVVTTVFGLDDIIAMPPSVPQKGGEEYAIVVHFIGAPPEGAAVGGWAGGDGDGYPRGALVASSDGGLGWAVIGVGIDLNFKTYVNGAPIPEPITFSLLGTSVVGLTLVRHHRRRLPPV